MERKQAGFSQGEEHRAQEWPQCMASTLEGIDATFDIFGLLYVSSGGAGK